MRKTIFKDKEKKVERIVGLRSFFENFEFFRQAKL